MNLHNLPGALNREVEKNVLERVGSTTQAMCKKEVEVGANTLLAFTKVMPLFLLLSL